MMENLAAQLQATLHVFGQRMTAKGEKGQTTAEYVGIVAFVALLVVALFALAPGFGDTVKGIIDAAFAKIKTGLG